MSTHPDFSTDEERAEYLKSQIVKGRKIMAIHFVRESEGMGLANAKEKVETIYNELRKLPEGHQDRPAQRRGMPGWLTPFMVLAWIIIGVVLWYFSQ